MSLIEKVYAVTIPKIEPGSATEATKLSDLVTRFITIGSYVIGVLAFIYLVYAGILYIPANGNDEQAKKGQKGIINAVIGIIVVVLALSIVSIATNLGNGAT